MACKKATVTNFKTMRCSCALVMMTSMSHTKNSRSPYTFVRWPRKRKSRTPLAASFFFTEQSGLLIRNVFLSFFFQRLQDIITEISQQEKNFKILVYANGFKKIRITEKIIKELGIDTFAYERTNVGKRRRAMKEKVYYSN